jgi:hypothetical protein
VGNLNLVLKHLIYQDEAFAVALGMGLGLPTGSDLTGTFGADSFRLTNDSVYLLPYLGGTYAQDAYFITGYMQLDVAANGDELTISTLGSQGKLNAPTFARFDLSLGYWLIQDAAYRYLDGVALVTEFHYITTLTNADLLQPNTFGPYSLGYDENRVDFLNFTTGLHFQLTELANLRVGAVFPMKTDPDRQFDGEIQVSFNRNF